ncbi:MAG: phytase, partial [Myxococcota bacterium]
WAQAPVLATGETQPVPTAGQSLHDPAIWLHPHDLSQSLILGTDEIGGGIFSWNLDGGQEQFLFQGPTAAIDVRYGFPLDGGPSPLIAYSELSTGVLGFLSVDAGTRRMFNVAARSVLTNLVPTGTALYVSPLDRRFYAFVSGGTFVRQWQLFADAGLVDARRVRELSGLTDPSSLVADDRHRWLFVTERGVGLWRFDAEPDGGDTGVLIDSFDGGRLVQPLQAVALYSTRDGGGYLIVSSRGDDSFVVYERNPPHAFRLKFQVVPHPDGGIGGVAGNTGIEVTNLPLNAQFPQGLFVAHDVFNVTRPNFKLVPWQSIADAGVPPLEIDTLFDAREGDGGLFDGGLDGGRPGGGGGSFVGPGTSLPPEEEGGCGCGGGSAAAGAVTVLVLLVFWAKTRRRG